MTAAQPREVAEAKASALPGARLAAAGRPAEMIIMTTIADDPAFTLRVYSHLMAGSHERARQVFDARLFRPRAVADGT
jgi:hypothetical protein